MADRLHPTENRDLVHVHASAVRGKVNRGSLAISMFAFFATIIALVVFVFSNWTPSAPADFAQHDMAAFDGPRNGDPENSGQDVENAADFMRGPGGASDEQSASASFADDAEDLSAIEDEDFEFGDPMVEEFEYEDFEDAGGWGE